MVLRIIAPYFVAGVVLQDGKVVRAADIVRYMIGWEYLQLIGYCRKKNWLLEMT